MPRITKDCFGTVISSLKKMKECARCELLADCRSINWQAQEEAGQPPVVMRRSPDPAATGGETTGNRPG